MTNRICNNPKYYGKYVAFDPSKSKKVIASGLNPDTVIEEARQQGVAVPAIVFVPKKNIPFVYITLNPEDNPYYNAPKTHQIGSRRKKSKENNNNYAFF